jgi:hypothetical protein
LAENYTTSIFNNAGKPPQQTGGGAAQTGTASTTGGSEQYQTQIFKGSQQGQGQGQTGGGQQTSPPAGGDQGWGIDWSKGGQVTMPQSVQDFDTTATNEAMAYTLPGLRAQAEAARKRLSPEAAAAADFTGATLSPTQLLNRVPVVGPELAGAAHEGIKSAVTNWKPDESWWDYGKNVSEDTALGGVSGLVAHGLATQAPKYFGDATRELVKGLPAGFLGLHFYGTGHDLATAAGVLGAYGGLSRFGNFVGKQVEDLGSSPYVQQAIKSLTLGAGSAARQQTGPLDQYFMPGP